MRLLLVLTAAFIDVVNGWALQERVKYYQCYLIRDPSGMSLRKMFDEKGGDKAVKDTIAVQDLPKAVAMLDLAPPDSRQMAHGLEDSIALTSVDRTTVLYPYPGDYPNLLHQGNARVETVGKYQSCMVSK